MKRNKLKNLQGAGQCIEDSACLSECIDRAKSLDELPKVLRAYEQIRKPRVEYIQKKGRLNSHIWHLPDGEVQRQRDQRFAGSDFGVLGKKRWQGPHIDDPPTEPFGPQVDAYTHAYDVIDHVSLNRVY